MSLKHSCNETLKAVFQSGDAINNEEVLSTFVDDYFNPPGSELVEFTPEAWAQFPDFLEEKLPQPLNDWLFELHTIWLSLCGKFIIAGGQFREFYYWDTFWIIKGLLASNMFSTVRGMIKNLAYMVDMHGFIPNGVSVTGDFDFATDLMPAMEKEFDFWLRNRSIHVADLWMKSIKTWSIVPADLSSTMCMNARLLAELNKKVGNLDKKEYIKPHYILNAVALYSRCVDTENVVAMRVYKYMETVGSFPSAKSSPTSSIKSGEQWDGDNAWAPLTHMIVEGFQSTGNQDLEMIAERYAVNWLLLTYQSYMQSRFMFKKYNTSMKSDMPYGRGGEHEVQTGFGWTNGVTMTFLLKYASAFERELKSAASQTPIFQPCYLLLYVFIAAHNMVL
ncbi:Trehalase domain containing protein [Trichuris trichiura]|uniref:Trehalase n=1 Tax=Trichuris trichiura TaxID=36087 RepID=A0A077ZJ66_TRITR|nr:Trehalase domain containing protein [Trichuris trichiura]